VIGGGSNGGNSGSRARFGLVGLMVDDDEERMPPHGCCSSGPMCWRSGSPREVNDLLTDRRYVREIDLFSSTSTAMDTGLGGHRSSRLD